MENRTEVLDLGRSSINYYDEHGSTWNLPDHWADDTLYRVVNQMVPNPLVVDLGCGTARGFNALATVKVGRYIGVDASKTMIEVAKKRFPHGDFRHGTLQDLKSVVPEICDGFLCSAMLMQIPRDEVPLVFKNIRSIHRTGAVGFISTPHGEDTHVLTHESTSGRIQEGHALLLQQWTLGGLEPILTKYGFEVVEPTFHLEEMMHITVRAV